MSDFFNNESNENKTNNYSSGEYSYSRGEINQGESYYQWSPYQEKEKKKKVKKEKGFGAKLGRTAAVALVFGLVAGLTFEGVVVTTNKITGNKLIADKTIATTESSSDKTNATLIASSSEATVVTDVSDIVNNVMPAIVQVTNVSLQTYRSFFYGSYQQESTSCGSGIIISQDDEYIYIASNNHVVSGADKLTITFCDDSAVEGTIKGTDNSCDLAVVAVKISDISQETFDQIKVATIGDSTLTTVGEGAVVIGNALGYGQSVTTGVISALDREVEISDDNGNVITNSLIQTDAAVNPGNSGGALLNMNGEVIGIVSAKLSDSTVEGMGYAIPISFASDIIEKMINSDVVSDLEASYLGIAGKDIGKDLAAQYNMPTGVYVAQVVDGSGAAKAGIEQGDVITSFDGRKVTSMSTIQNVLQYIPAGTTVEITVSKGDKEYAEEETYQVTLTSKNAVMQ